MASRQQQQGRRCGDSHPIAPTWLLRAPRLTARHVNDPTTIRRLYGRRSGPQAARRPGRPGRGTCCRASRCRTKGRSSSRALFGDDAAAPFRDRLRRAASISPTAPTCCPITASSAPSRSSTASSARSAMSATGSLANVRLHMGDALDVLERLPDASLRFVYLLHPDPWPKARHAKRRMINHGPLDLIAAKLAARRRVPPRHRRSDLLPLGDDGDGPAPRLRMARRERRRLPHPPRRLARDPLRGQGAAARATKSGTSATSGCEPALASSPTSYGRSPRGRQPQQAALGSRVAPSSSR